MYKLRLGQSYLSLGAFVCYAITLLFFIICFCSNHWWYFRLDGKVINMGLWTGCWQSDSGQTECSKAIFDNKVFKTGGGSDWYHGTRILMTCALIAIFLQEFALIGFLCINELDRYRQKLAGAVLGFSFVTDETAKTEAPCHSRCGTIKIPSLPKDHKCRTKGQSLQTFTSNGDVSK
uniref:Uncharacterized protein LOC111118062 isoform X4 n=1 Tax=Crassostrea virginica TaxID=6565 RepID=A0A8B8CD30_CRAVI|nr:uncharacterized protein LOC111118062 isoform X4 [Crassostrea virginica]